MLTFVADGPLSVRPLDAPDPVAAFFAAHDAGREVWLATSGSTGTPRAIVRTTDSWVSSFPQVRALTGLAAGSRMWLPGSFAATLTLFAAALARWAGASVRTDPGAATHAHLTPLQLRRALDEGAPLAGMHLTVAGDRLDRALHDRAVAAGAAVAHYYGAAELSFVAWGAHAEDLRAFSGAEIRLRDGVVWVRSPYLATACVTAGVRESLGRVDGFATVGDRGTLTADGLLRIDGRGPSAVAVGGATVPTADVERALRPGLAGELVAVGAPYGELGQVVAAVLTDPGDFAAARARARAELTGAHRPRLWFHAERLPETPAGKVDRAALTEQVARGALRRLVAGPAVSEP